MRRGWGSQGARMPVVLASAVALTSLSSCGGLTQNDGPADDGAADNAAGAGPDSGDVDGAGGSSDGSTDGTGAGMGTGADAGMGVCTHVIDGDVEAANEEDLEQLVDVCSIAGSLTMEGLAVTHIQLPVLESIGGALRIASNDMLTAVSLPALRSLGSALHIEENASLVSVKWPVLETVGEESTYVLHNASLEELSFASLRSVVDLNIQSNDSLTTLDLPGVTTGQFVVGANQQLASLSLPALTTSQGLSLESNASLAAVSLPALVSTARLRINSSSALKTLDVPALTTVAYELVVGVTSLPALSFPVLTSVGTLSVTSNAWLESISLPALESVGASFYVKDNNLLTEIHAPALGPVKTLIVDLNPSLVVCDGVTLNDWGACPP